jgi:hypothetical protein
VNSLQNIRIPLFFLVFSVLACSFSFYGSSDTPPNNTPTYESSQEAPGEILIEFMDPFPTLEIAGNVRLRDYDGADSGRILVTGSTQRAICDREWCYLEGTLLKFWRGCTSNNPQELGCQSK